MALDTDHHEYQRESLSQRALQQYLQSLNTEERSNDFFTRFCNEDGSLNPQDINEILQNRARARWAKPSSTRKAFTIFASAQKELDGVVTALSSLDPTPASSIIWSCIQALASAVDRYSKTSEKITKALHDLRDTLKRLPVYERFSQFECSPELDKSLCEAYTAMFCFWNKVYEELCSPKKKKIAHELLPLHNSKLDTLIGCIKDSMAEVEALVQGLKTARNQRQEFETKVQNFLGQRLASAPVSVEAWDLRGPVSPRIERECSNWIFEHPKLTDWRIDGNPSSRMLWVYGPPGAGKSVLCQSVAHSIALEHPSLAVASHFFRFDQNFTTIEVLKSLATQLWEKWLFHRGAPSHNVDPDTLSESLTRIIDDSAKTPMHKVLSVMRELIRTFSGVYFFVDGVDEEVAKLADTSAKRECRSPPTQALDVLDELATIANPRDEVSTTIRLWISSQDIPFARAKFHAYSHFDIKDDVKRGISCYLSRAMETLTVVPPERRESILLQLSDRVESNFLWAHLMIVELGKATSLAEMDRVLRDGRAETLDQYYGRFFNNILSSSNASVARDVFSLVTFARRPLKIVEIQEAIAILRSNRQSNLDCTHKPFILHLLTMLSPLIEMQGETPDAVSPPTMPDTTPAPEADLTKSCRLFHSTLFDFLRRHADLLCGDNFDSQPDHSSTESKGHFYTEFRVCPLRVGQACLLYLSQARYSSPLIQRANDWFDCTGDPVSNHHFLTYCAKNWDKHLDLVGPDGEDLEFTSKHAFLGALVQIMAQHRADVLAFLTSSNFHTCIQVQSLWIDGSFSAYRVRGDIADLVWMQRSLPRWIAALKYGRDYHRFWWDWQLFLSCVNCKMAACPFRSCRGDVDRCWWGALGSTSFLSRMQSRYRSFRFAIAEADDDDDDDGDDDEYFDPECEPDAGQPGQWSPTKTTALSTMCAQLEFQTVHAAQDGVKILRLSSISEGKLKFTLETWTYGTASMEPNPPRTQHLAVNEAVCNASLYAVYDESGVKSYKICGAGNVPIAAFSDEGNCLRIGTRLYVVGEDGEYHVFPGIISQEEEYIEEVVCHEGVIAVASRRGIPKTKNGQRTFRRDIELSRGSPQGSSDSDSEWARSEEDGDSNHSSSSSAFDDKGYETFSECSSAGVNDESSDSEYAETPSDQSEIDEDDGNTSREESRDEFSGESRDGSSDGPEDGFSDRSGSYADSDDGLDPSVFAFAQIRPYAGQELVRNRNRNTRAGAATTAPSTTDQKQVYLRVFTSQERFFSFRRKMTSTLSNSPPVLHPVENIPLLVWPLGGWDVLFADYEDCTYFVRELGTTSSDASNLLMKCRFTSDGKYLHVACFEGRRSRDNDGNDATDFGDHEEADDADNTSIHVQLLVYTYRLCTSQPTRTPPTLVHTSQVTIGDFQSWQLSPRLPCTLAWTNSHLYATWSGLTLRVYRIPLLQLRGDEVAGIEMEPERPSKTILLPASARFRDVFFFPAAAETASLAQVVVGGPIIREQTMVPSTGNLTTPLGCLLDPANDLGEWVPASDGVYGRRHSEAGHFNVPLEQFDPDVDCVLEPFLWQG